MKILVALLFVGLLLLTAIVGWLSLSYIRLNERVTFLTAENQRMAQQTAEKSSPSSKALRDAQAGLETAQSFITALGTRLSHAPALLDALNAPAAPGPRFPNVAAMGAPNLPPRSSVNFPFRPRLLPSSSHTPDGQLQRRSWGPEQVLGPPDTTTAGDNATAWAQLYPTGAGEEWLVVHYDRPVEVAAVNVRETYNPGAISKIAAVLPDGKETVLWEGVEPTSQAPIDMAFSASAGVRSQSLKIYLDRTRVQGYNEIDAVELVGRDGSRQWASKANTSSAWPER